MAGHLTVLPDELLAGRLGLLFSPVSGEPELLVFPLPGAFPGVRVKP